ncbi:hypothetical protein AMTRI_Chr04g185080 [Amborella trichopoda]
MPPPPSCGKGNEIEEGVLQNKSSLMESASNCSGEWAMGTLYKRAWEDRGALVGDVVVVLMCMKLQLVMRFPKKSLFSSLPFSSLFLQCNHPVPLGLKSYLHHPVPLGLKSYLHQQCNRAALMLGLAKNDSAADSSRGGNEYTHCYSSPSSYRPNSNPSVILSSPLYADYSMGFTVRIARENLVSRGERGGAIDIEALKQAGAPFSLTEAEALYDCLRTKFFCDDCLSPVMASARCLRKRLPIFSFGVLCTSDC